MKLTKAQRELLAELPTHVVPEYRPVQSLIVKGLATWRDETTTMLDITPTGPRPPLPEPGAIQMSLDTLLDRVRTATGPDRELEIALVEFFVGPGEAVLHEVHHIRAYEYLSSTDAALALVERTLPGCGIVIDREPSAKGGAPAGAAVYGWIGEEGHEGRAGEHFDATGPTFPIAILSALLSALTALQSGEDGK